MIDTDKYEGYLAHLEYELWAFTDFMNINATHEERCATDVLLNDAPLLLAEVKRLREGIKVYLKITDERPHNYIRENREKLRELIE